MSVVDPTALDGIAALRARDSVTWLGLMSGTSLDGIDGAMVEVHERDGAAHPRLVDGETFPFPRELARDLATALPTPATTWAEVSEWHARLGDAFAAVARRYADRVDAIALSGHTFWHAPDVARRSTLQLGDPARVAAATRRPVVAEFRASDVAAGGEGAPLVPVGDQAFFGAGPLPAVVINLGGISNFTWIDPPHPPVAADGGAANLVLNRVIATATDGREPFDRDGAIAATGRVHHDLLRAWLDDPFLVDRGWRSTGRERYGEAWADAKAETLSRLPLADRLATLVEWIAVTLERRVRLFVGERRPERAWVGGGGAYHGPLVAALERAFGVAVEPLDRVRHGVSADLREAAAFAVLGHEWLQRRPGSYPTTTGTPVATPLGSLWL